LYSASNSFSFAASGLRLSKPTELGILHLQFPFCCAEMRELAFATLSFQKHKVLQQITCVAGVFILAELSRPRISCMITMEVLTTDERTAVISAHDISVSMTAERHLST
jgi:hypothetical protein